MKKLSFLLMFIFVFILAACDTKPKDDGGVVTPEPTPPVNEVDPNLYVPTIKTLSDLELNFTDSLQHGVYYEIFVRSFADSDGDGVGDFRGIANKMDYLSDLGIDGIWLMPMLQSNSYHGYDVTDYYKVESDYGTLEDFEYLLDVAEDHDIKIIIDLVVNHTSSSHPWFVQSRNVNSEYRDYYTWVNRTDPRTSKLGAWNQDIWHGTGSYNYAGYFSDQMPDLNFNNKKVREEMINIGKFWMEKGVDGFRLDAAMHVYGINEHPISIKPELYNVLWWNEFRTEIQKDYPDMYLVGEIWESTRTIAPYFKSLHSAFNFAIAGDIKEAVMNESTSTYATGLWSIYAQYQAQNPGYIDAPFLTNHDEDRIASQIQNVEKLKLASDMMFMLSGNPYIYYGEEIGMKGTKGGNGVWDITRRLPMKWSSVSSSIDTTWYISNVNNDVKSVEEQLLDENSLLNHYKNLIALRHSHEALEKGGLKLYNTVGDNDISFLKYTDNELLIVVHNVKNFNVTIEINADHIEEVIYNTSTESQTILSPFSTVVFKIKADVRGQYLN